MTAPPINPMPAAEWNAIDPEKKRQMIGPYHQSIVYGAAEQVSAALGQSLATQMSKGGSPTQAMCVVAMVNDPALPFSGMPAKIRKKLEKKVGDLKYIVVPVERDMWTGGPDAPHWGAKHPYRPIMLELCKEPDPGKLWCVVFAGGGATAFQLGEKKDDADEIPMLSETGGLVAMKDIEAAGELVAAEISAAPAAELSAAPDAEIVAPAAETDASEPRIDPFEG